MKSGGTHGQKARGQAALWIAIGFVALLLTLFSPVAAYAGGGANWTMYQNGLGRDGDNKAEKIISPGSAPNLKMHWYHVTGGSIFTQPAVANKLVYWGSWDGYEHATDFNNNRVWTYQTGTTESSQCGPPPQGVSSSSAIATVTINGTPTSVDYFGGGTPTLYALNALTGTLIWKTVLGSSPSHYLWSSPVVYKGSVYIGNSSLGDCPLVQGQAIQLNAVTGQIENIFNTVPNGCIGASVWSSIAIDPKGNGGSGSLYFDTGNDGHCSQSEPYAEAMVELSVSNLSYIGSWQLPSSQRGVDTDFGATPTLFTANGQSMVGAVNKNGIFYAFKRDALDNGPVWTTRIGNGGSCPQCGTGNISSAAWDGSTLYVAGGNVTINGQSCTGSVNALNPATGAFIWQTCLTNGHVLGAVTTANGVVVVGQGFYMNVLDAASGAILYSFEDSGSGSIFYGPASISHGIIYIGNMDGHLYAIGT
jgi:outer membrane protein assembly factor BamB